MTKENRKRLARHFRAIGKHEHPYCKEFPDEKPSQEQIAAAKEKTKPAKKGK